MTVSGMGVFGSIAYLCYGTFDAAIPHYRDFSMAVVLYIPLVINYYWGYSKLWIPLTRKWTQNDHSARKAVHLFFNSFAHFATVAYALTWFFELPWFWLYDGITVTSDGHWSNCLAMWENRKEGTVLMDWRFKTFYQFGMAYHTHNLIVGFQDRDRPDFVELTVHHVTTAFLILVSYITQYTRIGILIMFLHDLPDVFVSFAKAVNLIGMKWLAQWTFPIIIVTWAYLRLYAMMRWCIWCVIASLDEWHKHLPTVSLVAGLVILWILNVIWFGHIMRMTFNIVLKGKTKDTSESETVNAEAEGQQFASMSSIECKPDIIQVEVQK